MWPFKKKEKVRTDEFGLPKLDYLLPMPKVKEPKKDISEPVISFVECYKNNPKRFSIKEITKDFEKDLIRRKNYILKDKNTEETFIFFINYRWRVDYYCSSAKWLTEDEKEYLYNSICTMRRERFDKIKKYRENKERKRLTKIYKDSNVS